jgi:hypothetical protein
MQIIQSKQNFVEKILRDKEGRLVRARFCVYENAGRIKARLVDVVYLDETCLNGSVLTLNSINISDNLELGHRMSKLGVSSPYFNFNILYSSGSKPRAPTFA